MGTRWQDTDAPRGDDYDARWARLAEAGEGIHGEADLVDDLLRTAGGHRVLDAGCGTGRVAIELARRGHVVVGIDADPGMLDTARAKEPQITWIHADLADVEERADFTFDVVLLAGNVMIFLDPGSEARVVRRLAVVSRSRRSPGGRLLHSTGSVAARRVRPTRGGGGADACAPLGHLGPRTVCEWGLRGVGAPSGGCGRVAEVTAMRIGAMSIDCAEPGRLADFYAELLGMTRIVESPDGRVVAVSDGTHTLAMMRVDDYVAPTWPEPARPQQMHLDISVTDLDGATDRAVSVGAVLAAHQPAPDRWRVFLDPAGHPFCLTTVGS